MADGPPRGNCAPLYMILPWESNKIIAGSGEEMLFYLAIA
jgi:hypothetical protein